MQENQLHAFDKHLILSITVYKLVLSCERQRIYLTGVRASGEMTSFSLFSDAFCTVSTSHLRHAVCRDDVK